MKKLISIALTLMVMNLHAYDLINYTYIINNTTEDFEVYFQRCTEGLNNSTVCQVSNKLTIPAENDGDNIGKVEIHTPYNNIHITRINSKTRTSNYASVSELLDYIKHGYKEADIMTCRVFHQSYIEHLLIENIGNKIACRAKEMFVS